MTFSACEEDGDDNLPDENGKIIMTTAVGNGTVNLAFKGTGSVRVEWGDGNVDNFSLTSNEKNYDRTYSSSGSHTIMVTMFDADIIDFICSENKLTTLDISQCKNLLRLTCSKNELTSLDVTNNTALKELHCADNKLTSLNVSKNTLLESLLCYGNNLTSLNPGDNPLLKHLDCSDNNLTALNVSKNTALTTLQCTDNLLVELDLSANQVLHTVHCTDNKLNVGALDDLFDSLHGKTLSQSKTISITGNPGANGCHRDMAEDKGWNVY